MRCEHCPPCSEGRGRKFEAVIHTFDNHVKFTSNVKVNENFPTGDLYMQSICMQSNLKPYAVKRPAELTHTVHLNLDDWFETGNSLQSKDEETTGQTVIDFTPRYRTVMQDLRKRM